MMFIVLWTLFVSRRVGRSVPTAFCRQTTRRSSEQQTRRLLDGARRPGDNVMKRFTIFAMATVALACFTTVGCVSDEAGSNQAEVQNLPDYDRVEGQVCSDNVQCAYGLECRTDDMDSKLRCLTVEDTTVVPDTKPINACTECTSDQVCSNGACVQDPCVNMHKAGGKWLDDNFLEEAIAECEPDLNKMVCGLKLEGTDVLFHNTVYGKNFPAKLQGYNDTSHVEIDFVDHKDPSKQKLVQRIIIDGGKPGELWYHRPPEE